jgi:hypothetical protein
MSLAALQASLAELVIACAAGAAMPGHRATRGDLSEAELSWLETLQSTAGFTITCEVQRWWREFRVQSAAPLTLSVLDANRRAMLVAEYVRRHARPSSFVLREALPFLELTEALASDVPHLPALVAFERAMLLAGEARASGVSFVDADSRDLYAWDVVTTHPLAEVVSFEAPPERVLDAASHRQPLPAATGGTHSILIAPGLPNLARACREDEAALFRRLRASAGHVAHIRSDAASAELLVNLWQAGALRLE